MNSETEKHQSENEQKKREQAPVKPGFRQLLISILGAALGVQSNKNRQKDFSSSSPTPYIIGGIIFGAVFVGIIALVVAVVLRSVG